jgi:hypothetical protein
LVEEGLKDEGCGDLIDEAAVVLAGVAGFVEDLVGFAGGEALVPEVDGEAGELAEFGGKGLIEGGLLAFVAGEVDGIADDDGGDGEAAGEAGERAEVFTGDAAAGALALEGEDGLGGEAELVGDCDADAAVADVEGEKAGWRGGLQGLLLIWRLEVPGGTSRVLQALASSPIQ